MKQPLKHPDLPGWRSSRLFICDTYLAKRSGAAKQGGLLGMLTANNLSMLRRTQLAPHVEKAMVAGRYLAMQTRKREAGSVVVVVRRGAVEQVYASNPFTRVLVADYDQIYDSDERFDAEGLVAAGGMHLVRQD